MSHTISITDLANQEIMLRLAPDDVVTNEDLFAHAVAIEEYRRGETVLDEDIDWD